MLYYTTTGWMMWNWLVGALAADSRIIAYDGSPVTPDNGSLWRIAEREQLTHFGASARYYAMLDKAGYVPCRAVSLGNLKCVLSTGSPLLPETFDWIYRSVKRDVHLASISGGTDILSCFVLGNPFGCERFLKKCLHTVMSRWVHRDHLLPLHLDGNANVVEHRHAAALRREGLPIHAYRANVGGARD